MLMSKTFRPWSIDQPLLLPASVGDFVGEDHLARFVLALVLEHLDLRAIEAAYASASFVIKAINPALKQPRRGTMSCAILIGIGIRPRTVCERLNRRAISLAACVISTTQSHGSRLPVIAKRKN